MADEKIRYVLDVDDKGTPKLVKFGTAAEKSSKQAATGFNKAGKAVSDFGQQIPGVGGALSAFAGGPAVAAGVAVTALAAGVAVVVSKSINMADNLNDLSLRLGVSTERLSVLSLYAEQSGTDIETVATAMGKLGAKLSDGDKELQKYGITAGNVDEALFQLADKIAATEDPMLRLKMATDAFGKSGQQMLPMLVQGGDALREMASDAPIVSSEMAKMADEFNDNIAVLKGSFVALGLQIAESIIPPLQKAVEVALDMIKVVKGGEGKLTFWAEKEEARAAGFREKLSDSSLSDSDRREYEFLLNQAESAAKDFRLEALEARVGKSSGPGSMGGYRGELPPTAGAIGVGATGKPGKPASAVSVDYWGGDAANAQYAYNQARASQFEAQKTASGDTGTGTTNETDFLGMYPDYYAGLPVSDKAQADMEAKYDEESAKSVERAKQTQAEINSVVEAMRGDVQSSFASAFQDIHRNGRDAFSALYDAFSEQFTNRVISSLASLATNSLFAAFGAPASGGVAGLLGFASGGAPPVSQPSIVGERRPEVFIPRGPGHVQPTTDGGGMVVNITVSNPAEARSTVRQLEREGRTRKRGIR